MSWNETIQSDEFKALSKPTVSPIPSLGPTREEALRAALQPFANAGNELCDWQDDDYHPDWSPFIPVGAYRAAAKALALFPVEAGDVGWRMVSDPPPHGEWVLAHDGEGCEKVRFGTNGTAWTGDWDYEFRATHWQPLPSPPLAEGQGHE